MLLVTSITDVLNMPVFFDMISKCPTSESECLTDLYICTFVSSVADSIDAMNACRNTCIYG